MHLLLTSLSQLGLSGSKLHHKGDWVQRRKQIKAVKEAYSYSMLRILIKGMMVACRSVFFTLAPCLENYNGMSVQYT